MSDPLSEARKSRAKRREVLGAGEVLKTRLPPRRTAHHQAWACTAASKEHTVLFVGAEICSVLIMQADEWASLALALIWSLAQQAQLQASDPGNRMHFLAIYCPEGAFNFRCRSTTADQTTGPPSISPGT